MIFFPSRIWALVLALLAWPAVAQANIGEDLIQLRARYGSAKDMGGQMLFESRLVQGRFVPARGAVNPQDAFSITVYFDGDHSAMEIFTHNTMDPAKSELTQQDIQSILAASSDGQSWTPGQTASGKQTWLRSDNKVIARFSPKNGDSDKDASVLVIMVNAK